MVKRPLLSAVLTCLMASHAAAQNVWGPTETIGPKGQNTANPAECTNSDRYAIGLEVYADIYIHGLRVECATLGTNGEHKSPYLYNGYIGSNQNGTSVKQLRCADGKVMVGIEGKVGWWHDRIMVHCKSWSASTGSKGTTWITAAAGGTGGTAYGPILCPNHYAVSKIEGTYSWNALHGWVVMSLRFSCKSPV